MKNNNLTDKNKILFFDDNKINVDALNKIGIKAIHVPVGFDIGVLERL